MFLQSSSSTDQNLEERYGGERFIEEHLTAAATSYQQGFLPPLQHFLPAFQVNTSVSLLHRLASCLKVDSLLSKLGLSKSTFVRYFGVDVPKRAKYLYYGLSSTKIIFLLLSLFALFSIVRFEYFLQFLPFVVQFLCLFCMLVSSASALINYEHLDEFRVWSLVLNHYEPELETKNAEKKFQARWHLPYLGLFLSLILFIALQPFVSSLVIVFYFPLFVAVSWLSLMNSVRRVGLFEHLPASLFFISLAARNINGFSNAMDLIFVSLFNLSDYVPILEVPSFQFTAGTSVIFVSLEVCSLFQAAWILNVIVCCVRKGFLPTMTLLVTWSWLSLTFVSVQSLSSSSQVFYPLAVWLLLFLSPAFKELFSSALPIFFILFLLTRLGVGIDVYVACAVGYILSYYLLHKFLPTIFTVVKSFLFWFSVFGLLGSHFQKSHFTKPSNLKWDSFQNICVPSTETEAKLVASCRHLEGLAISWSGTVSEVRIVSLTNWPELILSSLPLPDELKNFISCQVGEKIPDCKRSDSSLQDYERCVLLAATLGKDRCSLDIWNVYKFVAEVSMDSNYWKLGQDSHSISLMLDNYFSSVALDLKEGSEITFEGILVGGIGTERPRVSATKMRCPGCEVPEVKSGGKNVNFSSAPYTKLVVSSLCTFFLGPTLVI